MTDEQQREAERLVTNACLQVCEAHPQLALEPYRQLKWAAIELAHKVEVLRETMGTIAGFAPGNGDVCEIIARRARKALAETESEIEDTV
jgi:hypothetical protein